MRSSALFLGLGAMLALTGCPGNSVEPGRDSGPTPTVDGGRDGGGIIPMVDGGHDAATTPGEDTGVDAGSLVDTNSTIDMGTTSLTDANLAPDMGLAGSWDNCAQAVVFGTDGEGCSFTGQCTECVLTPAPRIALCMSGHLRVTAAGAGACASTPDAGMVGFPDSGPRRDAGTGADGGACNAIQLATPTTTACPMSVVDCIRANPSNLSSCVGANAACLGCVKQDLAACATQTGGCDDEAGRLNCCFEANCPDGSCATTTCSAQTMSFSSCVSATMCTVSNACFPVPVDCQPRMWNPPTAMECTAATLTCINALPTTDDGTGLTHCLDTDTTAPAGSCTQCWNDGVFSCVTTQGFCTQNLGDVVCCFDAACPTGDATCINSSVATGGACATQWTGFLDCVRTAPVPDGSCTQLNTCFP